MKRLTPIVVKAPQRSAEWYGARLGNVTASGVAKTMDYYKPKAADIKQALEVYEANEIDPAYIEEMMQLYPIEFCLSVGIELQESAARMAYRQGIVTERITKLPADLDPYVTKEMQWGIMHEITAKSEYHEITGNIVKEAPLLLHPKLYAGSSSDGNIIVPDTGEMGNLEAKCLASRNHLYKVIMLDEMPDEYWPQVQMQMWINGFDWTDFLGYDSRVTEDLKLFIKRIPYDEFYVDNVLVPSIIRFLDECDRDERKFYAIAKSRKARREANLELVMDTSPKFLSKVIGPDEVVKFRHPEAQGDDSSI